MSKEMGDYNCDEGDSSSYTEIQYIVLNSAA